MWMKVSAYRAKLATQQGEGKAKASSTSFCGFLPCNLPILLADLPHLIIQ